MGMSAAGLSHQQLAGSARRAPRRVDGRASWQGAKIGPTAHTKNHLDDTELSDPIANVLNQPDTWWRVHKDTIPSAIHDDYAAKQLLTEQAAAQPLSFTRPKPCRSQRGRKQPDWLGQGKSLIAIIYYDLS